MIPSLLSKDISNALKQFIVTGFETETEPFAGEFKRLVEQQKDGEAFIKGPYVSIDLPFVSGSNTKSWFSGFETKFPPFAHQEMAWSRLSSNKLAANTLVATGTGSGKTECFLYPVLDHCARNPGAGIKAIVIYPMNALATDQAKRFAETIHDQPALKGIQVGLFVGQSEKSSNTVMSDSQVITCKETLRESPPDILLTNYKMLDYLLMRPKDWALWQGNAEDTLKYLIVDELHTFDGAQGTDLALLIRRLRARLEINKSDLVCVGTSATLGDSNQSDALTDYASQVFDSSFDASSIVAEQRQKPNQFLQTPKYFQLNKEISASELVEANKRGLSEFLKISWELFFSDAPSNQLGESGDQAQREELGRRLKALQVLFKIFASFQSTEQKVMSVKELESAIQKSVTTKLSKHSDLVLVALLALLAHARSENGMPLVNLRVQLWARELRRMTAALRPSNSVVGNNQELNNELPPLLSFSDDGAVDDKEPRLPVVQCRECHGTAWLSRMGNSVDGLSVERDLNSIYSAFFAQSEEFAVLAPAGSTSKYSATKNFPITICSECGEMSSGHKKQECRSCGANESKQVLVERSSHIVQSRRGESVSNRQHRDCPYCGSSESLVVFGSRAASLSAVAIHQLFASQDNDDKKLIAFSDSVQDASHRAGFFSARTWHNNIRMGIAQCLKSNGDDKPAVALLDFADHFENYWLNSGRMPKEVYLKEFMPPDRRYRRDFEQFEKTGFVSNFAELKNIIKERALWQLLEDTAWRSSVGRSLNRVGIAALDIDLEPIDKELENWRSSIREQLGFELSAESTRYFIVGLIQHLVQKGAIKLGFLDRYLASGLNPFIFNKHFSLPKLGPNVPRPIFPATSAENGFKVVAGPKSAKSWFHRWLVLNQGNDQFTDTHQLDAVLKSAFEYLTDRLVLISGHTDKGSQYWGLNPKLLSVTTELKSLKAERFRAEHLPKNLADGLKGSVSLNATSPDVHYGNPGEIADDIYKTLFETGDIHRVIGHEHTGLLSRDDRQSVENSFIHGDKPWELNLLSATPTLEMGIDIGDLSSVLLCSVPPAQANYVQRVGRGGRRDGNSFVMTVANGRPHDLVFYHDPKKMMAGSVAPPAVFLKARHVLRRQMLAYSMDCWTKKMGSGDYIPSTMQPVLDAVEKHDMSRFPYTLLSYIDENMQTIWEGFSTIVAKSLSDSELVELQDLLFGGGLHDVEPLKTYVNTQLMRVVEDRQRLSENIETLKKEITKFKNKPADEYRDFHITELNQELAGYKRLRQVLNEKETLNFFTDEGLLPNYAFPEEGTTLHSVIYRSSQPSDDSDEPTLEKFEFEYQRPAQAALSELAPDSTFYAGDKKVKITRVETAKGNAIAEWRFCPRCNYSVELGDPSGHYNAPACPRCHTVMWSDSSAKAKMLKMTQVYAHSAMKDALLDDNSDDREPVFFNRQMLIDFDPKAVQSTWVLEDDTRPFGFEFVRKASFLEVNFGKRDQGDLQLEVAGEKMLRGGFKICQSCGMVQPKRRGPKDPGHLRSCQYFGASDEVHEESLVNCLYLYRQFHSEAIRILLPRLSTGGTEEQINSFVAALQLGLKSHFGGKVDHLRVGHQSEPIGAGDDRRHFLVLYDSVPGGTGYLQELLTDIKHFESVFRKAYHQMDLCSCNEGLSDGCYGCIHEYRNSRSLSQTKKSIAIEMLKPLINPNLKWTSTEQTLSGIGDDPWVDSELEKQFPEAIGSYNGHEVINGKRVKTVKDIINGKNGFRIFIGNEQLTMEPHVLLGPAQGVQVKCEPDFVIQHQGVSAKPPIAIFLDGYEYHKDIVDQDLLKRQALMQAGYIVWSLSWYDVAFSLGASTKDVPVLSEYMHPNRHSAAITQVSNALNAVNWQKYLPLTGMDRLMLLLAGEVCDYRKEAALYSLSLFDFKTFMSKSDPDEIQQFVSKLPSTFSADWPTDCQISTQAPVHTKDSLSVTLSITESDFKQANITEAHLAFYYREEKPGSENERRNWQAFWQMLNFFQFLPNFIAVTDKSLNMGSLSSLHIHKANNQSSTTVTKEAPDWVMHAGEEIQEDLKAAPSLWSYNIELGYELEDDYGEALAEAELALPESKLCLLLSEQKVFTNIWEQKGWKAVFSVKELIKLLETQLG